MLGSTRPTRALAVALIVAAALALPAPAFAAAHWGALAVSPRIGKVGVAYGYASAGYAKQGAKRQCHQRGCRVVAWVVDGYAALVLKRDGVFVAGVGRTRNLAFAKARERAHEPTAKRYAWVFSG